MSLRVAIIVQRYGKDIVGGAEAHARILAEQLTKQLGWKITVLTSAAKSYITWANEYPDKEERINGIRVLRFRTRFKRLFCFNFVNRVILKLKRMLGSRFSPIHLLLENMWILAQGPYVPGLIRHIQKHQEYDRYIFFTYLYYPTIKGIRSAPGPRWIVPTAHDEPAFFFQTAQHTFGSADRILANSVSERDLIQRRFPALKKIDLVGLGLDTDLFCQSEIKENYILYLGRLSRGKGVDRLIHWYAQLKTETKLYLAGVKEDGVSWEGHPNVRYLGVLSEEDKVRYIQQARALVNPSPLESLSLIVLEAASCGVPVIVNRKCEIFRYYESELETVYGFEDFASFKQAFETVLNINWTSAESRSSLAKSRSWVQDRYSWAVVIKGFASEGES